MSCQCTIKNCLAFCQRSRFCTWVNISKISLPRGHCFLCYLAYLQREGTQDFWKDLRREILLSRNFRLHSITIQPPCNFRSLSPSCFGAWHGLGHIGTQNFHISCFMPEPPAPEQKPSQCFQL